MERLKKLKDKRRILASTTALFAMPFYFLCGVYHTCIGGHMAHPPYSQEDVATDYAWVTLLSVALVFAFRSNISVKKTFIFLIVLMLLPRIFIGEGILTLGIAMALMVASIRGLKGDQDNNRCTTKTGRK